MKVFEISKRTTVSIVVLTLCAILPSCGGAASARLEADNPVRPIAPAPYGMEAFFANASPLDARQVRLGRWLFFDRRLSADNTVSCATCHRPEHAFSEPLAVPSGIGGQRGRRKTPGIINLAARTVLPGEPEGSKHTFFWDGRAASLEEQVLVPIAAPHEMGFEHAAMVARLSGIRGYGPYFREAFGSTVITKDRVASAIASYVRSLKSGNAPYDLWSYGRNGRAMSVEAQAGSDIFFFKGRCAMCHAGFNFSDGQFYNLGVGWDAAAQAFVDDGRLAVSHRPGDRGAFKTPGLRDVEKRAPYMHDGSLATLRDVVEFYDRGGIKNPHLSGRIGPLGLSESEKNALVSFLRSLSGEGYADQAPRYFPR